MSTPFALVLLAGEPPAAELLREEADRAVLVYCADGAAEYARAAGIRVDRIVGDLDSLSRDTRSYFEERQTFVEHVPDQYSDDFEKTLRSLQKLHTGPIRILGMTGKRTDHTLTNFSVMLKAQGWFESMTAVEEALEHFFLTEDRPSFTAELPKDSLISLSPFGHAHGIRTTNLLYPLTDESLALGRREGLSNRVSGRPVSVQLDSGALLISIERSAR
jgi:thiamine pyrophosphokinase